MSFNYKNIICIMLFMSMIGFTHSIQAQPLSDAEHLKKVTNATVPVEQTVAQSTTVYVWILFFILTGGCIFWIRRFLHKSQGNDAAL